MSFFTKSVFIISCSLLALCSSILLILSVRSVTKWYNILVRVDKHMNFRPDQVLSQVFVPLLQSSIISLFQIMFLLFFCLLSPLHLFSISFCWYSLFCIPTSSPLLTMHRECKPFYMLCLKNVDLDHFYYVLDRQDLL